EIGEDGNLQKCAVAPITTKSGQIKVIIPLEGLVDFDEEIKRINKTIDKLGRDISLLTNKLSNEKFIANADEDVVAADKELLAQSKLQIESMKDALIRFQ
ncbi:MAG: valine--tRNA ligase, partial [Pseudobdellovibrionaceae bacterium]